MKALIVNADDLGWTEGVNRGIREAHSRGIVSSASLLANGSAFRSAVDSARAQAGLGVGVHLNLNDGPPILDPAEVSSLVDAAGRFHGGPGDLLLRRLRGRLSLEQVEREWDAQIRKIRDAGIQSTHLDSHKHVHMLPGLFEIAARLATRHSIRAIRVALDSPLLSQCLAARNGRAGFSRAVQTGGLRLLAINAATLARRAGLATSEHFCGMAQTGALTAEGVERLLRNLPEGVTELMTHPGYADEDLRRSPTRLKASREEELAILTAPELRNLLASLGIHLVDYSFIA